jgi:hypothetical protein
MERFAAILAGDVVGYSRLTQLDETGTFGCPQGPVFRGSPTRGSCADRARKQHIFGGGFRE